MVSLDRYMDMDTERLPYVGRTWRSKKQEASDLADEACSSGCPACADTVTLTLQRESEVLCSVWWFLGTGGKGTWPGVWRLETGDWRGTWVQTRHWNRL